ncbi:hypothetical protein [Bradyrhizobium sp. CB2312]|uniref:hypothetical protein n=1 Tax=Bradyrhizobium sp. CB2312 TaxID=3039155 RepID=UPI0024B03F3F|nr:hypothetical protein [Bradyrhizobium sp. CB2312]WFU70025.1 hypothetical protein QA642_32755 [Bradyrhizobium sp. CB2312]
MTRFATGIIEIFFSTLMISAALAEPTEEQGLRRSYAARDLCVGPIARFANTPDPESAVSYDQGKFKIIRSKEGITVLEDNVQIAQFPKFDYSKYTECLEKFK